MNPLTDWPNQVSQSTAKQISELVPPVPTFSLRALHMESSLSRPDSRSVVLTLVAADRTSSWPSFLASSYCLNSGSTVCFWNDCKIEWKMYLPANNIRRDKSRCVHACMYPALHCLLLLLNITTVIIIITSIIKTTLFLRKAKKLIQRLQQVLQSQLLKAIDWCLVISTQ